MAIEEKCSGWSFCFPRALLADGSGLVRFHLFRFQLTTQNMFSDSVPKESQDTGSEPDVLQLEPPPVEETKPVATSTSNQRENRLSPDFVVTERIVWWILVGLFCIGSLIAWCITGFARSRLDLYQWLALAAIIVVTTAGLWASLFFPRRTYETTTWELSDHGIEIHKGIWWKHRIFIPRERIQHADVNQGPLMRAYALATLVINTGGTHEPSIELSGLTHEKALSLRDALVQRPQARSI
jgi:uncharacterized protein